MPDLVQYDSAPSPSKTDFANVDSFITDSTSVSTYAQLTELFDSYMTNMKANGIRYIRITPSATIELPGNGSYGTKINGNSGYFVIIYKSASSLYGTVLMIPMGGNASQYILFSKASTTWTARNMAVDALKKGTLPNNTNVNDVTEPGFYFLNSNSYSYSGLPSSGTFYYLLVLHSHMDNITYIQIAFYAGMDTYWIRGKKNATSWNSWVKYASLNETIKAYLSVSGTAILSNSDLDTYTTPGTYVVQSAAVAQSISNCPATFAGGRLEVKTTNSNSASYLKQIYYPGGVAPVFYMRCCDGNSVFQSWRRFSGEVMSGPDTTSPTNV